MIEANGSETAGVRKPVKSDAAFRTISEVSEDLDVPQHVLRFWESKFTQIKPLKRGGGRRYYRPEDLQLLKRIRDLLYKDGYTIRGVQKLLRDQSRGQILSGESKPEVAPAKAAPVVAEQPAEAVADPSPAPVSVPAQVPAVQPQLQLEATPRQERPKDSDIRTELKSLLAELEELRALLAAARQD